MDEATLNYTLQELADIFANVADKNNMINVYKDEQTDRSCGYGKILNASISLSYQSDTDDLPLKLVITSVQIGKQQWRKFENGTWRYDK